MPVGNTAEEMEQYGWKKEVIFPEIVLIDGRLMYTEFWFNARNYPCEGCQDPDLSWIQVCESDVGVFWTCMRCKKVAIIPREATGKSRPFELITAQEAARIIALTPRKFSDDVMKAVELQIADAQRGTQQKRPKSY